MTKPRASLLTLPTETLFQIISFLGSAHLKQLSLTNRSLYSLTPTYLFKAVVVYNISPFFLQTIVPKYGRYFRTLNIQGRASQEFIDQLGALLIILDDYCDQLENFNIIVLEQTPGLLEFNPPCFSQSLHKNRSKSLKLTCSAQLITFLAPIYFPSFKENNLDSSDLGLLVHAVIQSVFCLNHYTERYGSQITRAHLSFEGLSDVWVLELFNNCSHLQELVLERKYVDDYIEITDATLDGLCSLSNTLRSLSFISECDCPVTECFTLAGWKRMLCDTPNLEKLDISGLGLYFTSNLLPLIADHYKSRQLWLKQTNILNHLPSRNKHEQELMNLISICKNNLLALESSYITDAVLRCLAMYSPGLIRLCFDGDLLSNRKISLDIIEKRLVNLETFRTWNLLPRKWPIGLRERFGKLKNEYNCLDDVGDDDDDDLLEDYHKDFSYDTKLRCANVDSQIRRSRRSSSVKKHNRLNIWIILLIFFLIFYYFTTQEEIK